tara:strand:- start:37 stop:606 length:570 start_codon:yes stop_codon:yes gene_type:complete
MNNKTRDVRYFYDLVKNPDGTLFCIYTELDEEDLEHDDRTKCTCGVYIRYEYRVINKETHKQYPIGCVCINKFDKWKEEKKKADGKLCLLCKKGHLKKNTKIHKKCKKEYDKKVDKYLMCWGIAFNNVATRSEKINVKKIFNVPNSTKLDCIRNRTLKLKRLNYLYKYFPDYYYDELCSGKSSNFTENI